MFLGKVVYVLGKILRWQKLTCLLVFVFYVTTSEVQYAHLNHLNHVHFEKAGEVFYFTR